MFKLLASILILNLNDQISANHQDINENDHSLTDRSHATSTKTNFTLANYMGQ